MPTSEAPTNGYENEPAGAPDPGQPEPAQRPDEPAPPVMRGSRWVDYDTHELLEMISELEDERRWARLREGFLWALLVHILLISAFTWIPKYVFKVPQVIDPIDAIKNRKDLTYLDSLPDAVRELQPKVVKPAPPKQTTVDKKTLEALNREAPPPPAPTPTPAPQPVAPPPSAVRPPPVPSPALPSQPAPSEAPRPSAVPARPNFALNSQNPADQLRDAMRNASRSPGSGSAGNLGGSGLARASGRGLGRRRSALRHPGRGLQAAGWSAGTRRRRHTWDPLIPDEVNPPIQKSGMVAIRFKVLPNGRLMDGSLVLEGRSGDVALDRAAWGALTGSNYPPLPRDFHGPYLELRAYFLYNMEPPK